MAESAAASKDAGEEVAAAFPITDRKAWIAVLGIALLFAGVVGWITFGQLPQEVRGNAVILPTQGFIDIGRDEVGAVSEILVAPGDAVTQGQVVARVETASGSADVTAPAAGTIASILERIGGTTSPGLPLMTMSATQGLATDEVATAFVSAPAASSIDIGMPARVALLSYPQAQYGTITGTVAAVSTLPVTQERLDVLMGGNSALVAYFSGQGPVAEVTIALDADPDSATGYNWTIGTGPDREIAVGDLGEVSVITAEGSPLSRILR